MKNFKFIISYDGSRYFGWERQPGRDTIQGKLEAVLTAPDDEYIAMRERSLAMVEAHDINRTLATFEALYRGEPVAAGPDEGR